MIGRRVSVWANWGRDVANQTNFLKRHAWNQTIYVEDELKPRPLALFKDLSISRMLRAIQAVCGVMDLKSFNFSCGVQ